MKAVERILMRRQRNMANLNEMEMRLVHAGKKKPSMQFSYCDRHKNGRKNCIIIFVDLEKAFDCVSRKVNWRILRRKSAMERKVVKTYKKIKISVALLLYDDDLVLAD